MGQTLAGELPGQFTLPLCESQQRKLVVHRGIPRLDAQRALLECGGFGVRAGEPEREAEFDLTIRAGADVGPERIAKILGAPPAIRRSQTRVITSRPNSRMLATSSI